MLQVSPCPPNTLKVIVFGSRRRWNMDLLPRCVLHTKVAKLDSTRPRASNPNRAEGSQEPAESPQATNPILSPILKKRTPPIQTQICRHVNLESLPRHAVKETHGHNPLRGPAVVHDQSDTLLEAADIDARQLEHDSGDASVCEPCCPHAGTHWSHHSPEAQLPSDRPVQTAYSRKPPPGEPH